MTFDYRAGYQAYRTYYRELLRRTKTPAAAASLAVVGTIVLTTLLALLALRPTLVTISQLWREIRDETATIQILDERIAELGQAQITLGRIKSTFPLARQAIPPGPDFAIFAKELELLAISHRLLEFSFTQPGFSLKDEEATPGAKISGPVNLSMSVTVAGSEADIRAFLLDLERLDRLASLPQVSLQSGESSDSASPRLSATIDVLISYFHP